MDGFSIASVPSGVSNPALPDMQSIEVLRGPRELSSGVTQWAAL